MACWKALRVSWTSVCRCSSTGQLGEDALKLAVRRGDLVGDVVEDEVGLGVAPLDREGRIGQERSSTRRGRRTLTAWDGDGAYGALVRDRAQRNVRDGLVGAEQVEPPRQAGAVQRAA
jgi:hypothetical protein